LGGFICFYAAKVERNKTFSKRIFTTYPAEIAKIYWIWMRWVFSRVFFATIGRCNYSFTDFCQKKIWNYGFLL